MENKTLPAPLHRVAWAVWFLCIGKHIRYDVCGDNRQECIRRAKSVFCRVHKWPLKHEWVCQRALKPSDKWADFVKWASHHFDAPVTVLCFDVRPNPRVDRAGEAGSASNELFDSERSTGGKTNA